MATKNIKMQEKKIKQAEITKRIKKGWSFNKLCHWVEDNYGFSRSWSYKLVKETFDLLSEHADDVIESAKMVQVERLEQLLTEALESADRKTALSAMEMLNKIFGLYVQKQEVKVDGKDITLRFD